MRHVAMFYGQLVYFTTSWYTLWRFGIFPGHLVYVFSPFWYGVPRKIRQPWSGAILKRKH
jgi:hypothetical protein